MFKKGTALVPSFLAFAVVTLLEQHFAQLVDYDFTARMEDALDEIARGEAARVPWLRRFYFGADGEEGLKELVSDLGDIDARDVSSFPLAGTDIVVRVGRYGPYLERGEPAGERARGHGAGRADPGEGRGAVRPAQRRHRARHRPGHRAGDRGQGGPVRPVRHRGARRGRADSAKPRTASLLKSMELDTSRWTTRCKLLTLPRTIGELDGEPITVQNGRYGPYVKKGTDSRSLESEEQLFTLTLAEAKELFAQPKARGRAARAAAAPPLRELGEDPASGKPDRAQGGPLGPVRDRRRDQRLAAQGRRGRVDHRRSGRRNCWPSAAPPPSSAAPRRRPRRKTSRRPRVRREEGRRRSRVAGTRASGAGATA